MSRGDLDKGSGEESDGRKEAGKSVLETELEDESLCRGRVRIDRCALRYGGRMSRVVLEDGCLGVLGRSNSIGGSRKNREGDR